jgi:tricarballylate dehydrogenase
VRADVVVVGAGNAALCAALAARERGADVLVLERAPEEECGGNTAFTGGGFRAVYQGVEDIRSLATELSDDQVAHSDFGKYTEADFFADMARVTESRTDPELCEILVTRSFDTLRWMQSKGVNFVPKYRRATTEVDGIFKFTGGLVLEAFGGGTGLIDSLTKAARDAGVAILYGARATGLVMDGARVSGVSYRQAGADTKVNAAAVILACGGFEANAEWRTRYLGPGWELATVRGSRFNTGDGIAMALAAGAMSYGNWSGAHADPYGLNAPPFGQRDVGGAYQKHSFPFGIMVNSSGERFMDEGEDFVAYTYAKTGRRILAQPEHFAYQIFDQKVAPLLQDSYRSRYAAKISADSLEGLARRLEGVDEPGFLRTVAEYNSAVCTEIPFDPATKDGRCTTGLAVNKSNWANVLDTPPFEAFGVGCGITFTFGGLKISSESRVIDTEGAPIEGLFACGELVGGIFYFNYPGGTGLMNGAVFGRIAGDTAGRAAVQQKASTR